MMWTAMLANVVYGETMQDRTFKKEAIAYVNVMYFSWLVDELKNFCR